MKTTNLKLLIKLVVAILILGGGFIFTIYSGIYNVAATAHHPQAVEWVLKTTMQNSIRARAQGIEVPAGINLHDRALAEKAIGHYSIACAVCHGAPGVKRAPWMVTYPEPPELTNQEIVSRWSDAELYWIIKHGIKDTGMLALGPTHKEEDIWVVTSFVRQLPQMTAADYQQMVDKYQATQKQTAENSQAHHH